MSTLGSYPLVYNSQIIHLLIKCQQNGVTFFSMTCVIKLRELFIQINKLGLFILITIKQTKLCTVTGMRVSRDKV